MISKDSHLHSRFTSYDGLQRGQRLGVLQRLGRLGEAAGEHPRCSKATEQKFVLVQMFRWPRAPSLFLPLQGTQSPPGKPTSVSTYLPSTHCAQPALL